MRLSIKRMGQRGVTLVELVIVLCLIAIVSTSILGLVLALNGLVDNNQEANHDIQELTYFRRYIEDWFYSFDKKENDYLVVGQDLLIISDNEYYQYSIDGDIITVDYPSEKIDPEMTDFPYTSTYTFEGIKDIEFDYYEDTRLYKCTVTFGEEESFSFVLGRRS